MVYSAAFYLRLVSLAMKITNVGTTTPAQNPTIVMPLTSHPGRSTLRKASACIQRAFRASALLTAGELRASLSQGTRALTPNERLCILRTLQPDLNC